MAKPQARHEARVATPPQPAEPQLRLTKPLFGVTDGEDGKSVAVKYVDGKVVALTPKRDGRNVGESLHIAVARAYEAFKRDGWR
jgi:hypothetical protein